MTSRPNHGALSHPRGASPSTQRRRDRRAGFSMIEVVIATLVLTVGVLGLGGSTAYVVRQVTFADLISERSVAFQTVIDGLQSLPYDSVSAGADTVGVFALRWSVTPDGAQSKMVRIWTVGPGMNSIGGGPVINNPVQIDSFDFRVLRR